MGALQVITGQVTNPGATVSALTANAGDTFTVRSAPESARIELLQAWAFTTTNLLLRVRSPRMHDQQQNMRYQPPASAPRPLMPWGATERLWPQDPVTVELTGGAAEVDMATLLVYYSSIGGLNARLHHWGEIKPAIEHLTTIEVDLTSSATSCNYSATVALNGTFDTLVRNRDYAIIGYECGTTGGTLGITGTATGNLRLGGPLINQTEVTSAWFRLLSDTYGLPLIPVINAADVAGVLLDCACQATSTSFKVALHLAELSHNLAA